MKIGTLISSIIILLGTAASTILIFYLYGDGISLSEFQDATALSGQFIYFGPFLLFWFGLLFYYITQMTTKKLFLFISSILGFIAVGFQASGVLIPSPDQGWVWNENGAFLIGGFVLILSSLLMVIGCIQYRGHNKVAIISSILLFIIIVVNNVFFAFINPRSQDQGNANAVENAMIAFLIIFAIQNIFTFIHSLIFSFSKKDIYADDGADDMMSVETGDAFASYVPTGKKSKKSKSSGFGSSDSESKDKKKKSKKSKDAYSFDF